jgi:hypothetical protein
MITKTKLLSVVFMLFQLVGNAQFVTSKITISDDI